MAFNKPASQSSTWTSTESRWGATFTVNGQANCSCNAAEGPIAATDYQDDPWIKIDLKGTFFIKTVVVKQRNCKSVPKSILTQDKKKTYNYDL